MNAHDKQREGFIRAVARELLVHNPKIDSVDDALWLAEELLAKTPTAAPTHDGIHGNPHTD